MNISFIGFCRWNRIITLVVIVITVFGCALLPPRLKSSSDYLEIYSSEVDNKLNGKTSLREQIAILEENIKEAGTNSVVLPPGYHAHLGMLYFEIGDENNARQHIEIEKSLFPESTVFMDFLMKTPLK